MIRISSWLTAKYNYRFYYVYINFKQCNYLFSEWSSKIDWGWIKVQCWGYRVERSELL